MTLEQEISALLDGAFDPNKHAKERFVIEQCMGTDGSQPVPHNAARHTVGENFSPDGQPYTRERVRQIFEGAIAILRYHMETHDLELPTLRRAALMAESMAPCIPKRFSIGLFNSEISDRQDFSLESVVMLAKHLLDFDFVAFIKGIRGNKFWLRPEDVDLPNELIKTGFKTVSRNGACRVSDLVILISIDVSLNEHPKLFAILSDYRLTFVRDVLESDDTLVWLDDAQEWFLLTSVKRNRLLAKIRQMLAIQADYTQDEFLDAIDSSLAAYSGLYRSVPNDIVVSITEKLFDCKVTEKSGVTYLHCDKLLQRSAVFPDEVAELIEYLEANPNIREMELRKEFCEKRGIMTAPALAQRIHHSPFITTTERGKVAVTGSEAAREARARSLAAEKGERDSKTRQAATGKKTQKRKSSTTSASSARLN